MAKNTFGRERIMHDIYNLTHCPGLKQNPIESSNQTNGLGWLSL